MIKHSNTTKEIHTDSELALQNGGWNYRRLVRHGVTSADTENQYKDSVDENEKQEDVCRAGQITKNDVCQADQIIKNDICRDVEIIRKEVPELGTYRVEVTITAKQEDLNNLTLFAGRRNMIAKGISVPKGATYKKTFYQAVTPYIPALSSKRNNDKYIFVSIAGLGQTSEDSDAQAMISVEVTREDVPVIWIAGDSTLTDQNAGIPYYPYGSCAGWAQTLARYVGKAAVCNLAHSGMTTNCFRQDGHYAIFQEFTKAGDIFIMQFGHNDQKRRNLAAFGGYADNLRRYVIEVRQMGVEPIICAPISRIPLTLTEDEAKELSMARHYSLLQEYADASKSIAKELDVTFVDLHEMTFRKWIELGENARDYFMPGDITHTNEYGAVLIADYFVKSIVCANEHMHKKLVGDIPQSESSSSIVMAQFMSDGGAKFITAIFPEDSTIKDNAACSSFLPDSDTKILPAEYPPPSPFEIEPPYLDLEEATETEKEGIRKAFKYGLLDPCVMFIHPHDTMPRGQLLMVMFNAFRMTGVRPYKKKYPDIKVDEWISGYVQALIDAGYLDENEAAFRPDDPLTFGEFADFLMPRYDNLQNKADENCDICSTESNIQKVIKLGILTCSEAKTNTDTNTNTITASAITHTPMTRAEVYTALATFMDKAKEITGEADSSLPEDAEVHPVH